MDLTVSGPEFTYLLYLNLDTLEDMGKKVKIKSAKNKTFDYLQKEILPCNCWLGVNTRAVNGRWNVLFQNIRGILGNDR